MMVAWPAKHVGVILTQIYNCKLCAYLLVCLNSVKICTVYNVCKYDSFCDIWVQEISTLSATLRRDLEGLEICFGVEIAVLLGCAAASLGGCS
jgi:hypothetical protein